MGVTHLWPVLAPVQKRVALRELRGQTLAVDLGFWICEMQFIHHNPMSFQTPYLRTLYFRILRLRQSGVKLVFVVDGEATDSKLQTMLKRFNKGSVDCVSEALLAKMKSRRQFRSVQKQCCQLLHSLGIPHRESEGEAEKLCAILNQQGVVDGVLTSDGDAFLYGARRVYRNLSLSKDKDPFVELYDMEEIKSKIGLSREHLISFALLVGCDYIPKGVPAIGKEGALKFLHATPKPLHLFNEAYKLQNDSMHCARCKHEQKSPHSLSGCRQCRTESSCRIASKSLCNCGDHRKLTLNNNFVIVTLEKCCSLEEFPFKSIIKEFVDVRSSSDSVSLVWRCPSVMKFKAFTSLVYMWEDPYCLQQTVYNSVAFVLNHSSKACSSADDCVCRQLKPVAITKTRKKNFQNCFEMLWSVPEQFKSVFESYQVDENTPELKTVEVEEVIREKFPELVADFEEKLKQKAKSGKRTKRKAQAERETGVNEKENMNNEEVVCHVDTEKLNCSLHFLNLESPSKKVKTIPKFNQTPEQPSCVGAPKANTLKRGLCFSPSTVDNLPATSVPRTTSTPYRAVSPTTFFRVMDRNTKNSSPIDHKTPARHICPSPYLNIDSSRRLQRGNAIRSAVSAELNEIETTDDSKCAEINDLNGVKPEKESTAAFVSTHLKKAHNIVLDSDSSDAEEPLCSKSSDDEEDIVCLEDMPLMERLKMNKDSGPVNALLRF